MEESTSYVAVTVAGERVDIVDKYGEGDQIILVTADGNKYVAAGQDWSAVEPYDPEKHLGGDSTGREPNPPTGAPVNENDGLDATEMANAEAEAKANAMGVTTTTSEAIEESQAQEPEAPFEDETPAGDPEAVDEAETPAGDPGDSADTDGDPSDPDSHEATPEPDLNADAVETDAEEEPKQPLPIPPGSTQGPPEKMGGADGPLPPQEDDAAA